MINKRDYTNIHGNGLSQNEVDRKWLLFEQEQALFNNVLLSSGGGGSPQASPSPIAPPYGYILYFDITVSNPGDNFYLYIETIGSSTNVFIDYGDGDSETVLIDADSSLLIDHPYTSSGSYTVTLSIESPESILRITQE